MRHIRNRTDRVVAERASDTAADIATTRYNMEKNFAQFIEQERARLTKAKDAAITKKRSCDAEIATIDRELAAISAYERVKTDRAPSTGTRRPGIRTNKARGTGTRHSGIRQDVLNAIKSHPEGIGRADLLEAMGVKGEKSGEKSVSNSLFVLKKNMSIDLVEGKYKVTTGAKSNRNASQQYRRKPSGGRRGGGGRRRG
jgi:hypothetical protein